MGLRYNLEKYWDNPEHFIQEVIAYPWMLETMPSNVLVDRASTRFQGFRSFWHGRKELARLGAVITSDPRKHSSPPYMPLEEFEKYSTTIKIANRQMALIEMAANKVQLEIFNRRVVHKQPDLFQPDKNKGGGAV